MESAGSLAQEWVAVREEGSADLWVTGWQLWEEESADLWVTEWQLSEEGSADLWVATLALQ